MERIGILSRRRVLDTTWAQCWMGGDERSVLLDVSSEACLGKLSGRAAAFPIRTGGPDGGQAMTKTTLYERLGGYDAISAVASDLLSRMQAHAGLARFYQHRGEDGLKRSKQILVDYLCSSAGGPVYYPGRDMKITHKGMKISESDWSAFLGCLTATLDALQVPQPESDEVVTLLQSTKPDIVET